MGAVPVQPLHSTHHPHTYAIAQLVLLELRGVLGINLRAERNGTPPGRRNRLPPGRPGNPERSVVAVGRSPTFYTHVQSLLVDRKIMHPNKRLEGEVAKQKAPSGAGSSR